MGDKKPDKVHIQLNEDLQAAARRLNDVLDEIDLEKSGLSPLDLELLQKMLDQIEDPKSHRRADPVKRVTDHFIARDVHKLIEGGTRPTKAYVQVAERRHASKTDTQIGKIYRASSFYHRNR